MKVGGPVGRSVARSAGRPGGRVVGRSLGRLVARSVDRSLRLSLGRYAGKPLGRSVARPVDRSVPQVVVRSVGVAVARSVARSFHRSVARIVVRIATRMARRLDSCWGAFVEDVEAKVQPSTSLVGGTSKEDGMGRQSHRHQGWSKLRTPRGGWRSTTATVFHPKSPAGPPSRHHPSGISDAAV